MNFEICSIPRGQLNNVILSTMFESDKYGYEIIEDILTRSNNKIEIKQPSLYSALKRLESAKMLTSYWKNSEIGGDRHYYSITDIGKKHMVSWMLKYVKNNKLEDNEISAFEELNQEPSKTEQNTSEPSKTEQSDEQLDLFDKINIEKSVKETKIEKASKIADLNASYKLIQLKQYSEMDRKAEFEKIKKDNKTFLTSKFEPVKEFVEKKVETSGNAFRDGSFITQKYEQPKEDVKPAADLSVKEKPISECRDGKFITERIASEEQKDEIVEPAQKSNDYSNKVDGVFLDRFETIEEKPSVKKIEPAILNIESNLQNKINFNFQQKENKPEEKEQFVERKCTFASFQGLANYLSHLGIKFTEYRKM